MEGAFFKLWDSKEKLTSPNTLPAVRKTKGLRNSREEPPHPRWRKEAGERGKGQTQPQRSHPLSPGKQAPVPIERLPETLPGARWGCGGKRRAAPKESVPKPLAA